MEGSAQSVGGRSMHAKEGDAQSEREWRNEQRVISEGLGPHQARDILLAADVFHFGFFHVDLRITHYPPRLRLIESKG